MSNLQWLHTSGWWQTHLWGRYPAARCLVWPLPAASAPEQIDAGPIGKALWSVRCRPTGSSEAGAATWKSRLICSSSFAGKAFHILSCCSIVKLALLWIIQSSAVCLCSHLIWHPRAVCKLVAVSDSDDHRWFEEEWVTALGEEQ